ncbi:MAG: PPC domain-containing protein [Pirellulaceae bacterium]|nr:PPC domain-containing protein [Pirellulaceae bacterium]
MFFSTIPDKERRISHRSRTLRVESLERRELMDGYGLHLSLPSVSALVAEGEQPAVFAQQSSVALVTGNVRNDSISRVGEVDRFTVQASAGQLFQVAIAPNGNLNAQLRVLDSIGRVIVSAASTQTFARNFSAGTAGTYIVEIQGVNHRSVGTYRLGLESLSRPSADAKALPIGSIANGQLSGSVQVDQFKVAARAGQVFQVALATQSGLDATMRVYAPGGRMLLEATTKSAAARNFTATAAGEYIVQIQATNLTSTGSYRVGVESLSSPSADAKALSVGGFNNGQLTGSVQADQHRFLANSGQRFHLDLAPLAGLNAKIRVFEPGGRLVLEGLTSSARTYNFTSSIKGEFIVMIEAANLTSLGSYRLGLRRS